jgi:hypothetical protein
MSNLARCTTRSCPVRFAAGEDRACRDHAADTDARAAVAAGMGVDLAALIEEVPAGTANPHHGAHLDGKTRRSPQTPKAPSQS